MSPTRVGDHLPDVLARARSTAAQRAQGPIPTPTRHGRHGRPSRLNQTLIDRIADLVRDGTTYKDAAASVGVPRATFFSWKARGERARQEAEATGAVSQGERIYVDFLDSLEGARGEALAAVAVELHRLALGQSVAEIEVVYDEETDEETARVLRFAPPHERAMEFYLERSDPKNWAKRIEVSGPDQSAIPVEVEVSARESIRKRLGQVGKRLLPDESEAS